MLLMLLQSKPLILSLIIKKLIKKNECEINMKQIINLIFEWSQLKHIDHEGWRIIGVEKPESVAAHSLRAAQIGYVLAKLEKDTDPFKVCSMIVFHDIEECRIGDIHKIANRYVTSNKDSAVKDQLSTTEDIGKSIFDLWQEFEYQKSKEGILAKDADLLEMAFAAKEYIEKGYEHANDWLISISQRLKSKSAQDLFNELKNSNSNDWWQGLKKI